MQQGFIFGGSTPWTYEQLQRRRGVAEAMAASLGTPKNVGEGLASVGKALAIRGINKRADAREKELTDAFNADYSDLFGGNSASAGGGSYADAIASIESAGSGDYNAVGPKTGKGRAYGRYQVMDFNIGPWTEKHLGKRMTPQEFLASPQAQDAVFNAEFGSYVQKHGNPQDAASVWFSGRPMAKAGNASDGYTTVPEYVQKFTKALGGNVSTRNAGSPSPSVAKIAQLMGNPAASPGQRAMLSAMLQLQMQANDPVRQMQLERMQLEIDNLRNPKPDKPPTSVQEYEYYKSQKEAAGEEALSYEDWSILDEKAANPALVQAQNDAKATSSDVIINATTRAVDAARSRSVGGVLGQVATINPQSDNAEVYRQVESLKSIASAEALNAMRRQSATGGALGNVTEKELKLLSEQAGALDPASPNFERDLQDYTRALMRTIHGYDAGSKIFEESLGGAFVSPSSAEQTAIPTEAPDFLNEQDLELWQYYTDEERRAILNANEYRGRQ